MLSPALLEVRAGSARTRRGRARPSPKQRYDEYVLQRIEDYKNEMARDDLLRLGNDAVTELQDAPAGQYFLTEVLMQETVDRLITKRLKLPSFARWRRRFAKLREAQREPTRWGIEGAGAVAALLPRTEPGDHAVVVGGGAEAAAYLLAAYDLRVTCLCSDEATCTRIERRMAEEWLTGNFEAYVVMLGNWFPDFPLPVQYVVLDAGTLAGLSGSRRLALMARLQDVTIPGGLHALVPGNIPAAVETWLSLYPDWQRVPLRSESPRRGGRRATQPGILLGRPRVPDVLPSAPSQSVG